MEQIFIKKKKKKKYGDTPLTYLCQIKGKKYLIKISNRK